MLKRILGAVALLFLAFAAFAAWRTHEFLTVPPETPGRVVTVTIEQGMGFDAIARLLHKENVVSDPLGFRLLARFTKRDMRVRAGQYLLNTGFTPAHVLDLLVSGQTILYKLTVPEGFTMRQIAKLVEAEGLGSAESFDKACRDKELLAKYGIAADNAEGFLFPETYRFTKRPDNDARQVAEAMLAQFDKQAAKVWPFGVPHGQELFETVTLASIVEKETGASNERAKVAGVFANRLRLKMLLQTDPTIIYGLGDRYDGALHRSQLDDPGNPYNTYQHPGLPPGPICNPGLGALMAAAQPEQHDFLYFVSKNDGTHFFSKTLEEHNAAVAKYQLRREK